MPLRDVVVDVAGRDVAHPDMLGKLDHVRDPAGIAENEVVLELDEDLIRPEPVDVPAQDLLRHGELAVIEQLADLSLPAAGQQDDPLPMRREQGRIEAGIGRLVALGRAGNADRPQRERDLEPARGRIRIAQAVCLGQQAAEIGVSALGLSQQGQVRAVQQGYFRAGDRPHPDPVRELGELHRAVEAVVVGDRE